MWQKSTVGQYCFVAETWTLNAGSVKRLVACEMWIDRKMLQRVQNIDVLKVTNISRKLSAVVNQRKLEYIGQNVQGSKYRFVFCMGKLTTNVGIREFITSKTGQMSKPISSRFTQRTTNRSLSQWSSRSGSLDTTRDEDIFCYHAI